MLHADIILVACLPKLFFKYRDVWQSALEIYILCYIFAHYGGEGGKVGYSWAGMQNVLATVITLLLLVITHCSTKPPEADTTTHAPPPT